MKKKTRNAWIIITILLVLGIAAFMYFKPNTLAFYNTAKHPSLEACEKIMIGAPLTLVMQYELKCIRDPYAKSPLYIVEEFGNGPRDSSGKFIAQINRFIAISESYNYCPQEPGNALLTYGLGACAPSGEPVQCEETVCPVCQDCETCEETVTPIEDEETTSVSKEIDYKYVAGAIILVLLVGIAIYFSRKK